MYIVHGKEYFSSDSQKYSFALLIGTSGLLNYKCYFTGPALRVIYGAHMLRLYLTDFDVTLVLD